MTAWDAIYVLLRRAAADLPLHGGSELCAIDQTADGVTATFSGGRRASGDILIGADGVRSTVRSLVWPDVTPHFAGYVGWRCLCDESRLHQSVREQYFQRFCFHYPHGQQVLSYPVAGAGNALKPGERRLNIVWYRPVASQHALDRMLTDDAGTLHALGIPPPLIASHVLAEAQQAARALPEPFRSAIATTDQFFFQPIYDVVSKNVARGRVALAGDAAFTARPHVGAGVTKAAADAECLVTALQQAGATFAEALARYDSERTAAGAAVIAETRRLGATIMGSGPATPWQELEANMADTATLQFLY